MINIKEYLDYNKVSKDLFSEIRMYMSLDKFIEIIEYSKYHELKPKEQITSTPGFYKEIKDSEYQKLYYIFDNYDDNFIIYIVNKEINEENTSIRFWFNKKKLIRIDKYVSCALGTYDDYTINLSKALIYLKK